MKRTEQLSALFDNELEQAEQVALLEEILADPALQQQWIDYQCIRDVLQSSYAVKLIAEECLL